MKFKVKHFMLVLIVISLFSTKINYAAGSVHYPILLLAVDNKSEFS